jgi:triphosphoribosyl-dephospho-CoA synthase
VHPWASFADASWADFAAAAVAAARWVGEAGRLGVGEAIRRATVAATAVAGSNVQLGICLLCCPLAAVEAGQPLREGVRRVLAGLTARDSAAVYEAIAAAAPGGLGRAAEADVSGPAPADLVGAMRSAADRDSVARQYADGFADVFDRDVPALTAAAKRRGHLDEAIVEAHLELTAAEADSLIARKCGLATAESVRREAAAVLAIRRDGDEREYEAAFSELDARLRAEGNRLNPGTSADRIAAALFVCFRRDELDWPPVWRASLPGEAAARRGG